MAKKETEQRKKANDYRKEYADALLKVAGMESRIKIRTLNLCARYPDLMIPLTQVKGLKKGGYTTGEFKAGIENGMTTDTENYLDIMKLIEDHIASLHPHKQLNLYNDVQTEPK